MRRKGEGGKGGREQASATKVRESACDGCTPVRCSCCSKSSRTAISNSAEKRRNKGKRGRVCVCLFDESKGILVAALLICVCDLHLSEWRSTRSLQANNK